MTKRVLCTSCVLVFVACSTKYIGSPVDREVVHSTVRYQVQAESIVTQAEFLSTPADLSTGPFALVRARQMIGGTKTVTRVQTYRSGLTPGGRIALLIPSVGLSLFGIRGWTSRPEAYWNTLDKLPVPMGKWGPYATTLGATVSLITLLSSSQESIRKERPTEQPVGDQSWQPVRHARLVLEPLNPEFPAKTITTRADGSSYLSLAGWPSVCWNTESLNAQFERCSTAYDGLDTGHLVAQPRADYRLTVSIDNKNADLAFTWEKGNPEGIARDSAGGTGPTGGSSTTSYWLPLADEDVVLRSDDVTFSNDTERLLITDGDGNAVQPLSDLAPLVSDRDSLVLTTYPRSAPAAAVSFRIPKEAVHGSESDSNPRPTPRAINFPKLVLMISVESKAAYEFSHTVVPQEPSRWAKTRYLQLTCRKDILGDRTVIQVRGYRRGPSADAWINSVAASLLLAGGGAILRPTSKEIGIVGIALGVAIPVLTALFGTQRGIVRHMDMDHEPLANAEPQAAAEDSILLKSEDGKFSETLATNSRGMASIELSKLSPYGVRDGNVVLTVAPSANPSLTTVFRVNTAVPRVVMSPLDSDLYSRPPISLRPKYFIPCTHGRLDDSLGNRNGVLDAGETASVMIRVTNVGGAEGDSLTLRLMPLGKDPAIAILNDSFGIKNLLPDSCTWVSVPVSAGLDVRSDSVRIEAKVLQPSRNLDTLAGRIIFASRELGAPDFTARCITDNAIAPGRTVKVTVISKNAGGSCSRNVFAQVGVPSGARLLRHADSVPLLVGDIRPNDARKFSVLVALDPTYTGITLPVTIVFRQARPAYVETVVTVIPMGGTLGTPVPSETRPTVPEPPNDFDTGLRTPTRNPYGIAIVIGNKTYRESAVQPAELARNDEEAVISYLANTLGYDTRHIQSVEDGALADFTELFGIDDVKDGLLYRNIMALPVPSESVDVFVYYSGHGAADDDGNAYLMPHECHPMSIKTGGYPLKRLCENLSKLPARRVTLVLDACYSGMTGDGKSILNNVSPGGAWRKVDSVLPASEKLDVLSACSGGSQVAVWDRPNRHGLFTYYLLKGLRGEADLNGDGQVTYRELAKYVCDNVKETAQLSYKITQVPDVQIRPTDEDYPVVRLK